MCVWCRGSKHHWDCGVQLASVRNNKSGLGFPKGERAIFSIPLCPMGAGALMDRDMGAHSIYIFRSAFTIFICLFAYLSFLPFLIIFLSLSRWMRLRLMSHTTQFTNRAVFFFLISPNWRSAAEMKKGRNIKIRNGHPRMVLLLLDRLSPLQGIVDSFATAAEMIPKFMPHVDCPDITIDLSALLFVPYGARYFSPTSSSS